MSRWKVLIAHAKGEDGLAEKLAAPLRQAGYEVVHLGTVLVGDSIVEEASKAMSTGGPVVLCGTLQAAGSKWARRLVNAARVYEGVRVFAVQMDEEADLEGLALGDVIADYWKDSSRAMRDLLTALQKRYPLHDTSLDVPLGYDAELKYRKLVLDSCDIIDLANLPETERHLATRRLELRRLYVPLRVRLEISREEEASEDALGALENRRELLRRVVPQKEEAARYPIGERLSLSRQLVVLGDPGAGKSTLIRWIATAYLLRLKQDPDWKDLPDVATLPNEDWLPILIRCRDLDTSSAIGSLDDMLWRTLCKSELPEKEARALRTILRERLQQEQALLLIDGLDEIADPTQRARFCRQIEQIRVAYQNAPIIVTSRIVGYREMRQRIGRGFEHLTVADLSREEKDDFARRWSALTEPPGRQAAAAAELIRDIHSTDRIERLTGNPMLLTTLALVKRKVGKLPRRRADLYAEDVQVLLNWRAEVDEPIDSNEAIPQLEYIAYAMCERGVQRLRKNEILELLHRMREEYPQVHSVRAHTPEEFLPLLERRTGILVEAGHVRHLGAMEPVFEFRHLTIQEYLAARALVDGRFPGRDRSRHLAQNVAPLAGRTVKEESGREVIVTENWREALRLCVVCCSDDDVDEVLRAVLKPLPGEDADATARPRAVLAAQCLADEPNASEAVALEVLNRLIGQVNEIDGIGRSSLVMAAKELIFSRWSEGFQSLLIEAFRRKMPSMRFFYSDLYGILAESLMPPDQSRLHEWLGEQDAIIAAGDEKKAIGAALAISRMHVWRVRELPPALLGRLLVMLTGSAPSAHASALALSNLAYDPHLNKTGWIPSAAEVGAILDFLDTPAGDPEAVVVLLRLLGEVKEPRGFQSAIARLGDGSPSVRTAAVRFLGALQDPRAVQPLIKELSDPESYVRESAAVALGECRDVRAVEPLLALLRGSGLLMETAAIDALGKLQDSRAIQPLMEELKGQSSSSYVRASVLEALGNLRAEQAMPHFRDELRSPDSTVRRAAVESFCKFADARDVQTLIDCLSDPEFFVRRHAVEALGHLRDARALRPLIERLQDPESSIRNHALLALGELRDPRAAQPLLDRMLHDPDPSTIMPVSRALGLIQDASVVQTLMDKIDSLAGHAKLAALLALGKLQDMRPIPMLVARLQDPDRLVSFAAALALGDLRDSRAIQPLLERLKSAEPAMRVAAAEALGGFDEPSVSGLLEQVLTTDLGARRYAFHALLATLHDATDRALLTRMLDGKWPPWELGESIDEDRVRYAAGRLKLPQDEVKRRYEALAQRFPLKLAWRTAV
jgi:HEAT repeat protein/GTPase SAR1 family protein